jgi:hypothetical protein
MNKSTRNAKLVLNVKKTRKRIYKYYESLRLDKPQFRGGDGPAVFITSVIEQLFAKMLIDISRDFEDNEKVISRPRIIKHIIRNINLKTVFCKAISIFDSSKDYSDSNIVTEKNIFAMMDKYLDDENISLTPQALIFIRYLITSSFERCIVSVARIKKCSNAKSIKLTECMAATQEFLDSDDLFNFFKTKAKRAVELATAADEDTTSSRVKKKKTDDSDDESSDDSENDDDEKEKDVKNLKKKQNKSNSK